MLLKNPDNKIIHWNSIYCLLEFLPDVWLKILFCWLSVLLYPKIVDKRCSGGIDKNIKYVEDSVGFHQDQDGAEGLKDPVDHVEFHGYKVPIPPLLPDKFIISASKKNCMYIDSTAKKSL